MDEIKLDEGTLKDNLKKVRNAQGVTQEKIADSLKISVTAYQKLEHGNTRVLNPNYTKCAELLGVSLSELVNGFKPVKDAEATIEDVKESYGLKMRVQERGYLSELQNRDREIARLKAEIKDKDETISTQKLLIEQLMGRLEK